MPLLLLATHALITEPRDHCHDLLNLPDFWYPIQGTPSTHRDPLLIVYLHSPMLDMVIHPT